MKDNKKEKRHIYIATAGGLHHVFDNEIGEKVETPALVTIDFQTAREFEKLRSENKKDAETNAS